MFEKKIITEKVYFSSIRNGIFKELCGKYKVFLLLNESGDPPFLIQKFWVPMIINKWAKFAWKSMFSAISVEWP